MILSNYHSSPIVVGLYVFHASNMVLEYRICIGVGNLSLSMGCFVPRYEVQVAISKIILREILNGFDPAIEAD